MEMNSRRETIMVLAEESQLDTALVFESFGKFKS